LAGEIALPIVRIQKRQKAARTVHLQNLADYPDKRRARALKECRQSSGAASYENLVRRQKNRMHKSMP
jgi:hypothetical protein